MSPVAADTHAHLEDDGVSKTDDDGHEIPKGVHTDSQNNWGLSNPPGGAQKETRLDDHPPDLSGRPLRTRLSI